MVDTTQAGKPKFAQLVSKYAQQQPAIEKENKGETTPLAESPGDLVEKSAVEKSKIEENASSFHSAIQPAIDQSIKKRKHPRFKGERIPRTFKIPVDLDERMHEVYSKEGIEMQAQMAKALKAWLDSNYPE